MFNSPWPKYITTFILKLRENFLEFILKLIQNEKAMFVGICSSPPTNKISCHVSTICLSIIFSFSLRDDIANFITYASKLWSATAALLSNLNSTKLFFFFCHLLKYMLKYIHHHISLLQGSLTVTDSFSNQASF